jgi:hypothetical protein
MKYQCPIKMTESWQCSHYTQYRGNSSNSERQNRTDDITSGMEEMPYQNGDKFVSF